MEVGDPLAGVHHGELAALLVDRLDVCLNFRALWCGQLCDFGQQVAESVVDVHPQPLDDSGVFGEDILIENGDAMTEHDRVGDLHHGGLEMQGEQDALLACRRDLLAVKSAEGGDLHH